MMLTAVIIFMTDGLLAKNRQTANTIIYKLTPKIAAVNQLAVSVDQQRTELLEYIQTGKKASYKDFKRAVADERAAILRLKDFMSTGSQKEKLIEIESRLTELHQHENEILSLYLIGKKDEANQLLQSNMRPLALDIVRQSNRIVLNTLHEAGSYIQVFNQGGESLIKETRVAFILGLLLASIFAIITIRSITRPAKNIAQAAAEIGFGNYQNALALREKYSPAHKRVAGHIPRNEQRQIAVSIGNMAEALRIRERKLAAHADIGEVCSSTINLEMLLDESLAEMARHTRSQLIITYLYEQDKLQAKGFYGISPEAAATSVAGPDGLVEQVAKTRRLAVIDDIPDNTKFLIQPGLGKVIPTSIACIPMIVEDKVLGIMVLGSLYKYEHEMVSIMEASVTQIGVALSNAINYRNVQSSAQEMKSLNEQLDAKNEELQAQNEELIAQRMELQEHNENLEVMTRDLMKLQAVTAALVSLDPDELLTNLLEAATDALGLEIGLIMLLEEDGVTLRNRIGRNSAVNTDFELRIGEGFAGRVAETREIMRSWDAQTEKLLINPCLKECGARSIAGVPLVVGDQLFGVALFGDRKLRKFSDREKYLLSVFAMRSAVAIDRAQSYSKLRQAEESASSERERLQAIIDNLPEGVIIATAPDGEIYMANKTAMGLFGLKALPNETYTQHSVAFNLYRTDGELYPYEELPLSRSLLRGDICLAEEIMIRRPSGDEIVVLCNTVPIRDDESSITGSICVFQDITAIKEKQKSLQQTYEHHRDIAETLQKSFLPSALPLIDGYEFADAYLPAQEDTQVGGDFYDLIELDNGVLGVVIGDVSGKGVSAAIYTAMAKYMLRGFAHENPEPVSVLSRLNDAVSRYARGDVFITLFYGILYTDERRLVYSNGGHERPLLFNCAQKTCNSLNSTGPAIGIIPKSIYTQMEVTLSDGEALLLFTDGITEARRNKDFLGPEGLKNIIIDASAVGARDMTDHVLACVHDYSGGKLSDDVAMMVIKPNC